MRLGRRGFCAAVDHPIDRAARRRRVRTATIVTGVLVAISLAELTWILVR